MDIEDLKKRPKRRVKWQRRAFEPTCTYRINNIKRDYYYHVNYFYDF